MKNCVAEYAFLNSRWCCFSREHREVQDREDQEVAAEGLLLLQTSEGAAITGEQPVIEEGPVDIEPLISSRRPSVDVQTQASPSLIDQKKFTISDVLKTDRQVNAFTGLSTRKKFECLLNVVAKVEEVEGRTGYLLPCRERLMLVLIKLKLNLTFICLSAMFDVTPTTCKNYFADMIKRLGKIMEHVVRFPDSDEIKMNLPRCFKKYETTRIVLDCTEVRIEKSKCLKCRIATYSHYYGSQTMKVMVGVAPSGLVTYISPCYGGRTSDKEIFMKSGLLEKVHANESIMVDKGFLIEKECLEKRINLIRPPFLADKQQMSAADAITTASIAAARVHVERCIQRFKIFKILKGEVSVDMLPFVDNIMVIIAGLVNLSTPVLGPTRF